MGRPFSDYVGVPYKDGGSTFDAADCLGITWLWLQHEAGLLENTTLNPEDVRRWLVVEDQPDWHLLDRPVYRKHDVLVFKLGGLHAAPMVSQSQMLGTNEKMGSHVIDLGRQKSWGGLLQGAYRHASML